MATTATAESNTVSISHHIDHGFSDKSANEDFIHKAIDSSNLNALRMALLQVTGDPELAKMRTKRHAIRGGAMFAHVLSPEDAPLLKEKAFAYLSKHKKTDPIPPPPSKAGAKQLADLFGDEPVEQRQFDYDYEELAFEDFPRSAEWTEKKPSPEKIKDFKIIIIGAGISGIAAAVQFKRLGLNFEVHERQGGIGGTWLLNTYPQARVDTSSYLFQFKFVKNYAWTEFFATAGETRRYLEHVAEEYKVRDRFHFNREVVSAVWKDAISRWEVIIKHKDGTTEILTCNAVVSGSGLFATPNLPKIKGIENFKGPVFHTARWDHSVDYKGKRVALLGTGSTGTQLASTVAAEAGHFTVYQRTPNWIMNLEGYKVPRTDQDRYVFDNMPYYWNWYCYAVHVASQQLQYLQEVDPDWVARGGCVNERNDLARAALTEYVKSKCGGIPGMVEKVLPQYPPLVRRLVVDNGFYDMLSRDNVDLVAEDIECFTDKGIKSKDGIEREFDVVILGTGFKTSQYFWPCKYVGRDGITLESLWKKDGPRSYLGLTMPGFPNFFSFYGPNHQPRSGGFYSWGEIWSRYTAEAIIHLIENDKQSMDVKRKVFDEYNDRLDKKTAGLIWEYEGKGYYVNEHGRQSVNAPWHTADYHKMVSKVNFADYEIQ